MKHDSLWKLKILGNIGRVIVLILAAISLIEVVFGLFGIDLVFIPSFRDHVLPFLNEFENHSGSANGLEHHVPKNAAYSTAWIKSGLASGFRFLNSYLVPAALLWLSFIIFHQFAKGEALTKRIFSSIRWIGISFLLLSINFQYFYSEVITSTSEDQSTFTTSVRESEGFVFLPQLLLLGVFFLSLGLAMKYGADLKSENDLTV